MFVERSQGGRKEEGLDPVNRLLKGSLAGPVVIREGAARLSVDLLKGQKTGFFLDQREHRLALGRMSRGCRVLNAFGYTGGFSIHAGLGGAGRGGHARHLRRGPGPGRAGLGHERAGPWPPHAPPGRRLRAHAPAWMPESFERVVVDPPAFAKQRKDVDKAFKAYKDLFRLGARATAAGGVLGCFSCSQHMERARFQEAVWTALLEAGREAQVLAHLGQPMDHPYALNHPEGSYLKGLWLRML